MHSSLLAAFIAVAFLAGYTSSHAQTVDSDFSVVGDDTYPMGTQPLSPYVQDLVQQRGGQGLSAAGFYNDPGLPPSYRAHGPQVIYSVR